MQLTGKHSIVCLKWFNLIDSELTILNIFYDLSDFEGLGFYISPRNQLMRLVSVFSIRERMVVHVFVYSYESILIIFRMF